MADDTQKRLDETVPGGAYVKDGVVVDANGEKLEGWTVDKDGNVVRPTDSATNSPFKARASAQQPSSQRGGQSSLAPDTNPSGSSTDTSGQKGSK